MTAASRPSEPAPLKCAWCSKGHVPDANGDHYVVIPAERKFVMHCVNPVSSRPSEERPAPAPFTDASLPWRCFHCDEVFTDEASAREHFGANELETAGCVVAPLTDREKMLLASLRAAETHCRDMIHRAQESESNAEMYSGLCAELTRYFGSSDPWFCYDRFDCARFDAKVQCERADEAERRLAEIREAWPSRSGVLRLENAKRIDAALAASPESVR